jgi:hypothetical protein
MVLVKPKPQQSPPHGTVVGCEFNIDIFDIRKLHYRSKVIIV